MKTKLLTTLALMLIISITQGQSNTTENTINPRVENNITKAHNIRTLSVQNKDSNVDSPTTSRELSHSLSYLWIADAWVLSSKKTYEYDDKGRITTLIGYTFDGENYVESTMIRYLYNFNDRLIEKQHSTKDYSYWLITNTYEYKYLDENVIKLTSGVGPHNILDYTVDYSYNSSYLLEEVYNEVNDSSTIAKERVTYDYAAGPDSEVISEKFYTMLDDWSLVDSSANTISTTERRYLEEEVWYHATDSGFFKNEKNEYKYDLYFNPIEEIHYYYDSIHLMDWVKWDSDTYSYNYEYTISEANSIPLWDQSPDHPEYMKNEPIGEINYKRISTEGDLDKISKTVHYYSTPVAGLENTETSQVNIYPNPTNDYIKFNDIENQGHFELINLQGKIVISKDINSSSKISVKGLTKGTYLYLLNENNNTQRGSILIY